MVRSIRIRFRPFTGLDLNTAKIRMAEGAAQTSNNFDYEKPPGTRLRPGYARLLALDGSTVVKSSSAPSRLFAFERDDDVTKLVLAYGGSMSEFEPGDTEWT